VPLGRSQRARDTGVAGHHVAKRRARELPGLLARDDGFGFALGIVPRHAGFPAEAVVENKVGGGAPAILRKQSVVLGAGVKDLRAGLGEAVRCADEEVGEVNAGLAAGESILTVFCCEIALVDLVIVELPTELQRVRTDHLGEGVQPLEGVVVLPRADLRHTDRKVVKGDVWYAFQGWLYRTDASGVRTPGCNETQF
jgi:hypothetical protein